jgi:hypothetical protein
MTLGVGTIFIFFAAFPAKRPRARQGAESRNGTSNQDPLETSKVNALDSKARHDIRPSTRHASFLGKGWASTDDIATTPTYQPP